MVPPGPTVLAQGPPREAPPAAPAAALDDVDIINFKSALNETVMTVTQRPLASGDIEYRTSLITMVGGLPQYQSTVRINALEAREFDGTPQGMRKAAEQAAAQVALQQLASAMRTGLPNRAQASSSKTRAGAETTKLPNYKGRLQEILVNERLKARIFGDKAAGMGAISVTYSSSRAREDSSSGSSNSQFHAKVHISAIGLQMEFGGDSHRERRTAEQSAAHAALTHFLSQEGMTASDTALSDVAAAPVAAGPGGPSYKSELNELVMKILRGVATPEDIIYGLKPQASASPKLPLFTAFVRIPALAPDMEFVGKGQPQKRAAEQLAALEALNYLKSLPTVPRVDPQRKPPATFLSDKTGDPRSQAKDSSNHKSSLNEFIMRIIGRPVARGEIVYTVRNEKPGHYQATAKIPIMDTMEFQAAPRTRKRDAEQCAAQIALLYYQAKYPAPDGMHPNAPRSKVINTDGSEPNNFKSALNELAMRTTGRALVPGDITFVVRAVGPPNEFQATVVPTILAAQEFVGETAGRKKDAEQSAAAAALKYFCQNPPAVLADAKRPPVLDPAVPGSSVALSSTDVGNYKSALNELVMRSVGRPLAKTDISYSVGVIPSATTSMDKFQASVKVASLDGEAREFEGSPRSRKREAEQSAAKAALQHFQTISHTEVPSQEVTGQVPVPPSAA